MLVESPGLLMDKNGQDEVGRCEPHSVTDAGKVVNLGLVLGVYIVINGD